MSLSFFKSTWCCKIPRIPPQQERQIHKKNLRFTTEIAVYLGNCMTGPQLLWITNSKSKVADRSVSVPMTFSDLERRDAIGPIFLADLCMLVPLP